MAIKRARDRDVPLPKIRQAVQRIQKDYELTMPLAHRHRLMWLSSELFIELPDKQIFQVSGFPKGQQAMEIAEPFMDDLHFDQDGMSELYTPKASYGRTIIFNPNRQFGQPLVSDTGYRADILADAYEAEGMADTVAAAYGIATKDVLAAVEFMSSLRKAA